MANLGSQSRNYWKKFHLPFHHSTIFMTSFLLSVSFFHLFIIFATDLPAHVLTDILREHKKFCFKFDGRFFSLTCLQICSLRFRALKGKFRPEWVGLRSKRARGDGQTDKQTNGQMSPVPYVWQDFVPFGAATLLPLIPIHNHVKQGNGYRWPHVALAQHGVHLDS